MLKKRSLVLLPIILVVALLLLIVFIFFNTFQKQNQRTVRNNISANLGTKNNESLTLIGTVWTSGLAQEEKDTLGINSNYQLVKTSQPKYRNGWGEKTDGMYLINNDNNLSNYLGKCVSVYGKIKNGWEYIENNKYEINGRWTYRRSAMVVSKLDILELDNCLVSYDVIVKDKKLLEGLEYKNAKGTLDFAERPAPDISYDFKIILDEPFIDAMNASGKPVLTKQVDISAGSYEIYKQVISNLGKKIGVGGYMEWGYAESRFLRVDKIQTL